MPQHITSRQNARVKDAARLRDARQRQKQGRFLIDGARETLRAIAANIEVIEAFVCGPLLHSDEARQAAATLQSKAAAFATVDEDVFEKLRYGDRSDGVLTVARTPQRLLESLHLPTTPLVAVLEGVEKPGNVGAVLRSADGAGVDAVVIAQPRTDLFNPNTIRSSLGTVFKSNVCTATTEETLSWLKQQNIRTFAARPDAALCYTEADYRSGTAIVLGSEAEGLTASWNGEDITGIRLPMHGLADSLNVSAAAAVLFYEARRQRTT